MIALRIRGEIENLSSILLNNELYPMGQVLRGAFGYIFLDMGLKISESYWNGRPILYFRDSFVKCICNGNILPSGNKIYVCDKCGRLVAEPTIKDNVIGTHIGEHKVNSFYVEAITGKNVFNFEVILNMKNIKGDNEGNVEQRLSDFLGAIKYVEDNGLNIGKRGDKGFGKLIFKKLEKQEINKRDIDRRSDYLASRVREKEGKMTIHFLSDVVSEKAITSEDILRDCKNAAKFFGIAKWSEGGGGGKGGKGGEGGRGEGGGEGKGQYDSPKLTILKRENDSRRVVEFLDLKIDPITR